MRAGRRLADDDDGAAVPKICASKRGIRVNVVAPGLTDTRMAKPITKSEASKEAAVSKIPLNRINLPEEVSDAILWLLTNAPDNITGQILHLDGGMSQVRG